MGIDFVRYIAAAAIALVLVALLAVIGVAIARGTPTTSSQLLGLLAFVGTLVGVLANLIGTRALAANAKTQSGQLTDVQEKVNGHLAAHVGHSDDQVQQLIDQRLAERGILPMNRSQPPGETG